MTLTFTVAGTGERLTLADFDLVIAGYTGRDGASVRKHIDELAAIGVAPPESVPAFYPVDSSLATQAAALSVEGSNTSGEVEPVLVRAGGRLYLTVGSDHTDRDVERASVAKSKAACAKPVGTTVVAADGLDWDAATAESGVDGVPYQSGSLSTLRVPTDVLSLYQGPAERDLVLFCGTLPLLDSGFVAGTEWTLSLTPPGGPELTHSYTVTRPGTEGISMAKPEYEFFPARSVPFTPCDGKVSGLTERILAPGAPGVATRILRFDPGTDTAPNGVQVHDFWEEVYILEGSFTDTRLGKTFTAGDYACRPPHMEHGPWTSVEGCTTFEVRYRA